MTDTDRTLEQLKAEMEAAWDVYQAAYEAALDAAPDARRPYYKALHAYYKAEDAYLKALESKAAYEDACRADDVFYYAYYLGTPWTTPAAPISKP